MTAVVFMGGAAYTVEQSAGPEAGASVIVATPPPPPPPTLAIIGDSFSAPADNWAGPDGWGPQVARANGAQLVNLAVPGSGYVRAVDPQYDPPTFPVAATRLPERVDVVVIFGGYNDRGSASWDVVAAVRATCATVRRLAPDAALIVIGPQWPNSSPEARILVTRDAVRDEAAAAAAIWLDPIAGNWFGDPARVGPDGVHPSRPAGQDFLASVIGPVVADALDH